MPPAMLSGERGGKSLCLYGSARVAAQDGLSELESPFVEHQMSREPIRIASAIVAARGSSVVRYHRRGECPIPSGPPECPEWLPEQSKVVWAQLIPRLTELGVLSRVDQSALARYCVVTVRLWRIETLLDEQRESFEVFEGERLRLVKMWPEAEIARNLASAVLPLEVEFGLTPAARARLVVAPPKRKERSGYCDDEQ